jgi:isocitrate/isopropylmalate dehydrogenase
MQTEPDITEKATGTYHVAVLPGDIHFLVIRENNEGEYSQGQDGRHRQGPVNRASRLRGEFA